VLNLGPQPIGLRSKRVSQFDDVELAERCTKTTFTAKHLSAIDATLRIAHDRKLFAQHRIAGANRNRRLSQPRRRAESTKKNDCRDGDAGADCCQPVTLPSRPRVLVTPRGHRPVGGPLAVRRWRNAMRRAMPKTHDRSELLPSNVGSRRCTTTNTSCSASSTDERGTPSRKRLAYTNVACSRYTAANGTT